MKLAASIAQTLRAPWRLFTWLYDDHLKETVAALFLLVAMSAAASGYANIALGRSNAANAVTSCENSNESREASRALWGYVLDLLVAGSPSPTPAETTFVTQFRDYVSKVYRPHDCADLSRKYPAPTRPTIPTQAR